MGLRGMFTLCGMRQSLDSEGATEKPCLERLMTDGDSLMFFFFPLLLKGRLTSGECDALSSLRFRARCDGLVCLLNCSDWETSGCRPTMGLASATMLGTIGRISYRRVEATD